MGVNFKLIFILTGLIFILSSCRTSAPRLDYQALARAPSCWAWTSIWKITTNSIWNRPNGLVFLIVEAVIQNAVPTVRDSPTRYTGKYTVLRFREIPKT